MSDAAFIPIEDNGSGSIGNTSDIMFIPQDADAPGSEPPQYIQQAQQEQQVPTIVVVGGNNRGSVSQPLSMGQRGSYGALNDNTPLATPVAAASAPRLSLSAANNNNNGDMEPLAYPMEGIEGEPAQPRVARVSIVPQFTPAPPALGAPVQQQRRSVDVHQSDYAIAMAMQADDDRNNALLDDERKRQKGKGGKGGGKDKDGRHGPASITRLGTVRDNVDDEEPEAHHRPYFVVIILIANIIMFIIEMGENNWTFESFSTNPMLGPSQHSMIATGAKWSRYIREGDWYRLIAPMFLHAGIFHLIMNMYVLVTLGRDLESAFGWWRITCIYFISGEFGLLMSAIFLPTSIGVGASGALYGLIGAMFGDFIHNHKSIREGKCGYLTRLIANSLVGLCMGLLPALDNFNHLGGWLMGIVSSIFFLSGALNDHQNRKRGCFSVLSLSMLLVMIVMLIIGYIVLFAAVNARAWCPGCAYVSCFPNPWWSCDNVPQQCYTTSSGALVNCTAVDMNTYNP